MVVTKWCLVLAVSINLLIVNCAAIINGNALNGRTFSYAVSICVQNYNKLTHICGGTIISKWFVLTAAHCVRNRLTKDYAVLVGSPYRLRGDLYLAKHIYVHEKYTESMERNDIAMIQLSLAIGVSVDATPIPFNRNYIDDDFIAVVTGWGDTKPADGNMNLKYIEVKTINATECRKRSNAGIMINMDTGMCAHKESKPYAGICAGDSGGALTFNGTLIGVSLWCSKPCAVGQPDGYLRISEFIEWIENKMMQFI